MQARTATEAVCEYNELFPVSDGRARSDVACSVLAFPGGTAFSRTPMEISARLFKYYVIRYVPDVKAELGIDVAVVAVSHSYPSRTVLMRIPSLAPVLELDSEADVELLHAFLDEVPADIRLDPQYLDRALRWENSIRVLPPKEFVTSDFESTFALLSEAELGIGSCPNPIISHSGS